MTSSTKPPLPLASPDDEPPALAHDIQLQFDVVKLDYERTLGVLDGVSRTRTTMRAAAVTAYVAFLTLALQQKSWALGAGAALVAAFFAGYDAYHGWLYRALLRRANALERLFQHRLHALDRAYDPYLTARVQAELERYDFGTLGQLPRFNVRALKSSPNSLGVAYAVPLVAAALVASLIAW